MANLQNLVGGVGDKVTPDMVDPVALALGTQVEMEHTSDVNVAREIAIDHLTEDPQYYTKLVKAGLSHEFGPNTQGSGYGDPDTGFNDPARIGYNSEPGTYNNMTGTIGGTSDGSIDGRNSDPIINKTIDIELQQEAKKKKAKKKPKPTNPSLWSRAKSMARSKFDVYPSAYANAWAAKWYKKKGGGWRMSESNNDINARAFDGPFPAQVSPDGQGTYMSGYDYVGYAESKNKMKERIRKIINRVLNEQVGMYQVIKFKLVNPTYELISVDYVNSNNIQTLEEFKNPNNKIMKDKSLKESIKDIIRRTLNEQEGEDINVTDTSVDATVGAPPAEVPGAEVEEDTVTITMDKDTAQKLHDLLMAQLSDEAEGGEAETETDDQLPPSFGDDEGAEQSSLAEGKNKKWIQKAVGKPGALHKQLGVPADKKIPKAELKKGGKLGQRARLAITLGKLAKKKKG